MELLSNITSKEPKILSTINHLEIVDFNGYTAIKEKDMVVCIPYLVEQNNILLRYENIPTYEYIKPEIDKYVTIMSTVIEDNQTPLEALKTGLLNEFGLQINKSNIDILTPIFLNKGNTSRYHICILPLMSYEFEQIEPTEVKKLQMKNNNISINISELNHIMIYDLITRYCLDLFKQHYSLF